MPHRSSVVSAVLAGFLLCLLLNSVAEAATLTVTSTADSGAGSLRNAITAAAAGDTITFAAGITTINLTTGQLLIDKNLTINGGSGVAVTRQAGSPNFRIFTIASGSTVILDGLIISNGNAASDSGGGIANAGTLTLRNSTVSGNTANGIGGGISNTGTFNLDRTHITSNHADFSGGGIGQIDGGILDLRNSLIDGNSSTRDGGGLTSQSISVNANVMIVNCTFANNTAGTYAGAILNVATGAGTTTALALTNSTIVGNSSAAGYGAVLNNINNGATNATATLQTLNTLYANNNPSNLTTAGGAVTTSLGNNLSSDGSGGGGPHDLLNTNPLLAPLGNYGGPTLTFALQSGSPAIDQGSVSAGVTTDQRGYPRPVDLPSITNAVGGNGSDIGAFEVQSLGYMVFSVQPSNTVAGAAISPAITVQIVDQFGNPTTSTANVTLVIGTNPGGGTLSGTTTVAAVNGVATFSNLSIDKTGTGYTLTAASSGLTGATSSPFNVTAAAVHHLAFNQQPTTTVAGVAISPAVTVRILDAFNNLTTSTANVTLVIGTNPGGGTLSGTTTVAAVNGVATFSNLSIDKTGTGYTLTAASSGLTGATSSPFNVTAAAAHHLAFSQQPTTTVAGAAISPAVTVQIVDQFGNLTASTANVTLAIGTNPGGGTLFGITTVAAVNGVATFGNLSINHAGTGYTLTAASNGLTNVVSDAFNITQASTTTTIMADTPDPSAVGQAVTVQYTVAVVAPGTGTPTGTVTVSDGVDSCVGSVAAGTCAITLHTVGSRTLTASYAGDGNFAGSTSAGVAHSVLAITAQGDAGGGLVTAAMTGGTCVGFASGSTHFTAAPTPLPAGVTFAYGVFGFTAVCPSDGTGTLTLTLTYPNLLPPGTRYWKYGPTADNHTSHWYVLPATLNGNTAIFKITDGGLGDDDRSPNGQIVDQGGPGVPAAGIPTLGEWALLLLMGLLGLALAITARWRAPPNRPV